MLDNLIQTTGGTPGAGKNPKNTQPPTSAMGPAVAGGTLQNTQAARGIEQLMQLAQGLKQQPQPIQYQRKGAVPNLFPGNKPRSPMMSSAARSILSAKV